MGFSGGSSAPLLPPAGVALETGLSKRGPGWWDRACGGHWMSFIAGDVCESVETLVGFVTALGSLLAGLGESSLSIFAETLCRNPSLEGILAKLPEW